MPFQTPLSDADPELLAELREAPYDIGALAALALGFTVEAADIERPYYPVHAPDGSRFGDLMDTVRFTQREGYWDLLNAIEAQGLGFMIVTVFDKGVRTYKARVFRYLGSSATDGVEAREATDTLALAKAFVAFHEAALATLPKTEAIPALAGEHTPVG